MSESSDENDALAATILGVLNAHNWDRARYDDHAPAFASIGNWGFKCPCGDHVAKSATHHNEHLAERIARIIPPGLSAP